jgi:hypothetical protein
MVMQNNLDYDTKVPIFARRELILQPIPRSSGISSGVPQTRQITAEQSPQVSGSPTSRAQVGQ